MQDTPIHNARFLVCKRCLMPSTRPRIVFDDEGICNACRNAERKQQIDWDQRRREFLDLVEKHRPRSGPYDCIVPWSGGKDSSMIALRLKEEFGLNPLLVTFSPMIPSEVGLHNREMVLREGFDHLMVRPNQRVARHLARRFFLERGNPKVCWDAGINAVPVSVAVNYGIPLLFYAEHGESEYGGHVLSEEHLKIRDIAEVLENQIGDDPANWVDDVVTPRDLAPYVYPDMERVQHTGVTALYFAYFFKWDVFENYEYVRKRVDFRLAPGGRTDGTFTGYDSLDDKIDNLYYHMQYIKFGFGRGVRDASRLIQFKRATRDEALKLALTHDDEFPQTYLEDVLDYLDMDRDELVRVIDMHRNPEIWTKSGNRWMRSFDIA
ncbi:MAG: N-acetyl sugar amidotransferase [Hyphomicrobiales bacterium]